MEQAQLQQLITALGNSITTSLQPLRQNNNTGGRKKLSIFTSAKDHEWRGWRENFAIVAEINDWNDLRQRQEAAAAMEGAAKRAVSDINHTAPGTTINRLLDAYEARFITQASSDMARVTFIKAKQKNEETILQWHTRTRELFVRAYPNQVIDTSRTLIDQFILGLHNPKIIEHVWDRRPATFSAALEEASNKVASLAVIANRSHAGSTGASGGVHIKQEPGIHAFSRDNRFDKKKTPNKKTDRACWNCDQKGHLIANCPHPDLPRHWSDNAAGARRTNGRTNNKKKGYQGYQNLKKSLNAIKDSINELYEGETPTEAESQDAVATESGN